MICKYVKKPQKRKREEEKGEIKKHSMIIRDMEEFEDFINFVAQTLLMLKSGRIRNLEIKNRGFGRTRISRYGTSDFSPLVSLLGKAEEMLAEEKIKELFFVVKFEDMGSPR